MDGIINKDNRRMKKGSGDKEHPCKSRVETKEGKKEYCEQGPEGHWGTCMGGKPEYVYEQQLKEGYYETWNGVKL